MSHPVTVLQFENTAFEVVERDGQIWLRGQQIADALGYQNHRQAIDDLYKRNAHEFSGDMTDLLKLPDLRQQSADAGQLSQADITGQIRLVRVFSLRGAHLLGMFARTEKAAAFRCWVLDVLDAATRLPERQVTADDARIDRLLGMVEQVLQALPKVFEAMRPPARRRTFQRVYRDDLVYIQSLFAKGYSLDEVAQQTQFSKSACYGVMTNQFTVHESGRVVFDLRSPGARAAGGAL